jgi:hypothetical protein
MFAINRGGKIMTDDKLQRERNWLVNMLPCYLAVQGVTLLLTFLEIGIYNDAYHARGYMPAGGWMGVWLALLVVGLGTTIYLLVNRTGKSFELRPRIKLAAGFWLGVLAGLLTLGMRFATEFPASYYWTIFALLAVSGAAYAAWNRLRRADEEMFP